MFWVLVNMSEVSSQYLINPWLWSIPLNCSPKTIGSFSSGCLAWVSDCSFVMFGIEEWEGSSDWTSVSGRPWELGMSEVPFSRFLVLSPKTVESRVFLPLPQQRFVFYCFFPNSLSTAISYKKSIPIILFITTQGLVHSSCLNAC